MKRLALILALQWAGLASAAEAPLPATLPPASVVQPLLLRDPSVEAARAQLDAGEQEALLHEAAPHEWNARWTRQQRSAEHGLRYQEWNLALERTLRLPAKRAADDKLAGATRSQVRANYGETVHEAARLFLGLWLDWLAAEHAQQAMADGVQAARANLDAVEKRQRAGDAARLERELAQADLAEQQRAEIGARTAAQAAWARLSVRFPGVPREVVALPLPPALGQSESWWRERILSESDELKQVEALAQRSAAQAERAQAEKIPDPTIGLFRAAEMGGRERLTGISLSVPLPGAARGYRSARSAAEARVGAHEVALKRRELDAAAAAAVADAGGALEGARAASTALKATRASGALVQRAYQLGEGDLNGLLMARRQSSAAALALVQAEAAAARAYGLLLVDAHLVWDLEHD